MLSSVNIIDRVKIIETLQSHLQDFLASNERYNFLTDSLSVILYGGTGDELAKRQGIDRVTVALAYKTDAAKNYLDDYRASMTAQDFQAKIFIKADGTFGGFQQAEKDAYRLADGIWQWANELEPYDEIDPNITEAIYHGIQNIIDDKPGFIEINIKLTLELHYDSSLYL